MKITEDFIIQFTGNASAVSNGRKLAAKKSYVNLYQSQDQTLLFGSCAGSGKNPYQCSVDFSDAEKPIPRCSCPSRQIPCKHVVGLLFCHLNGETFTPHEIPEDVLSKREKIQKRKEKSEEVKSEEPKPFTKAKATAAIKKCRMQLDGIGLAEKILHNIVLSGLHSIDAKNEKMFQEQVKELGNYYIGGIQAEFSELLMAAREGQKNQNFTEAVEHINQAYALLRKSKAHLANKIADYEAFPEMTKTAEPDMLHSSIEEQMGYAWKLAELREKGLYQENAELLQASFDCYDDVAKKQWVDEGIWISLKTGDIYRTFNYRPYRAKKYIREEDSFFPVLMTSELSIYPGDKNPRVRWEKSTQRDCTPKDYQAILKFAEHDFAAVLKNVKAQIKSPLNDKHPVYLLSPAQYGKTAGNQLVISDQKGVSVLLKPGKFGFLFERLAKQQVAGSGLVCRFTQSLEDEYLYADLLAVVNQNEIIRFKY